MEQIVSIWDGLLFQGRFGWFLGRVYRYFMDSKSVIIGSQKLCFSALRSKHPSSVAHGFQFRISLHLAWEVLAALLGDDILMKTKWQVNEFSLILFGFTINTTSSIVFNSN